MADIDNTGVDIPPEDWIALHDVIMKYAQSIDTKDWELFRTVFVEDIQLTYGEPWGPFDGIDEAVSSSTRSTRRSTAAATARRTSASSPSTARPPSRAAASTRCSSRTTIPTVRSCV